MLSEEALERLSERLVRRIEELNTLYINSLGEQLNTIGKLTPTQLAQLFQTIKYGGDLDKIVKKISEVTRLNVNDIYSMFEDVAKTNQNYSKKFYEYKNIKFIPYEKNKELQNYVKSMAEITVNDYINMSKTMAYSIYDGNKTKYTSLAETYQTITDRAILEVTQGRDSYEQSIRKAMKELTEKGLRTIDYASGYSRRLDSSVRMNIMDGLSRLSMNLQEKFGEEFGADGIEVSHHVNPAPDHENTVDGRQFSKNRTKVVNGIEYKDFNEINNKLTRHVGEMNCYHITYSIVLGVSAPLFTNEELESDKLANAKGFEFEGKHYTMYEGTQLQRQIETKIRQYKERQIGAESIENFDEVFKCKKKIRQLTNKYKELSDISGLPTKVDRLRIDGHRKINIKPKNTVENKWFDKLTHQEQNCLKEYISSGSYKINESLYNNRELTEEQIIFRDNLDSALAKAPKYHGYVNRSVSVDNQEQLNAILSVFDNDKRVGSWDSYISSSKKLYDENMKLQFIIKSKNGRDLSSLNNEGGGEILFERQTKFKYIDLKRKDSKIYVSLEEEK